MGRWRWALVAALALPAQGRLVRSFLSQSPNGTLSGGPVNVSNLTGMNPVHAYLSGPCAGGFCTQLCEPKGRDEFNCGCELGYTLGEDGASCNDVNECAVNNGGCVQECVNFPGNHLCACSSGYRFNETCAESTCTGTSCVDVNECLNQTDGCEHTCTNTQGSYVCSCAQGFFLEPNRHNCSDINECPDIGCDHYCENLEGSFSCHCYEGFAMVNGSCVDVNECAYQNGGCAHECTNTPGSFICSCKDGYDQLFSNCLEKMEFASALQLASRRGGRGALRWERPSPPARAGQGAAGLPSPLLRRLRSIVSPPRQGH